MKLKMFQLVLGLCMANFLMAPTFVDAQPSIQSVTPAKAYPGDTVDLSITLQGDRLPPADITLESVTVGTIQGTNIGWDGAIATAQIIIPVSEAAGTKDVSVQFPTPPDQENPLIVTGADAFQVLYSGGGGTDESEVTTSTLTYAIVDTGQIDCYSNTDQMTCPSSVDAFYGQDAQHSGNQPNYTVSDDGLTVQDNVTGLTWTQSPDLDNDGDIDADDKKSFDDANAYSDTLNAQNYGGYSDWRLPTMKELYSLMNFKGTDPSGPNATDLTPFIDTDYFAFAYGDESAGERLIDAQFWSSNAYVGQVFVNQSAAFGLNFGDGRIKGYPTGDTGGMVKKCYVYFVRGNTDYGVNDFIDNEDSTITDKATGLMWTQDDSGTGSDAGPRSGMNWEDALAWVQQKNAENHLGYNDWRLPNAKEMQSILDYDRAPGATGSAAIDPIFNITQITNEAGEADYPWFWTSTTHVKNNGMGDSGAYVCFGRAMGYMNGSWLDVHGAGAQRSDQKGGNITNYTYATDGYYFENSPQGDAIRINNYVRLVRDAETTSNKDQTTGLFLNEAGAYQGYTLFAPMLSKTTYLVDMDGNFIYSWESAYQPGLSAYLLADGSLLRTGNTGNATFNAGGAGGVVERLDADANVLWTYNLSNDSACLHHDVEYLPNGNILMIAWEMKTEAEAIAAGRNPSLLSDGELWPDMLIEVNPDTNEIVWEWRVWDHLIQDYDSGKPNYGTIADHPERIDLNYVGGPQDGADWTHINSVEYIKEHDQILVSVHEFSEIWVIDHGTTIAQAASSSGGTYGKGGDLLYRWGNPQAYGMGTEADQVLFSQHDASWIAADNPGAGNILIFNNGARRPDGDYSSIEEITPPMDASGNYARTDSSAFGPDETAWTYTASTTTDFYAQNISGAQRLPNGNTLICEGTTGTFFEVTSDGAIVWKYVNPVTRTGVLGPTDSIPTMPDGIGENQVFNVKRYAPGYSGLSGIVADAVSLSDAITILQILVGVSDSTGWNDAVADARATLSDAIQIIRAIAGM